MQYTCTYEHVHVRVCKCYINECDNWPHHFLVPHASLVVLMCSDVISCRPDGMELPMEKTSEYEAHDIKVCVWVFVCVYMCVGVNVWVWVCGSMCVLSV